MRKDLVERFGKIGVGIPEILLPAKHVDLSKWSVIACDQYTSQPEYWESVEKIVGVNPSTFHIILPEVYLEDADVDKRISRINKTMESYLKDNILVRQNPCFIYVERQTSHSFPRKGLIISIDLEKYNYGKESKSLIRATEETVIERIPSRLKIRQNAPIELPHVMLLIDDPCMRVIEPLSLQAERFEKIYDFELMMSGGHIKGYKIDDTDILANICDAFESLIQESSIISKYGTYGEKSVMLFAVGDGNHSLASAKAHWENIKQRLPREDAETHPARFALVEVVNVHDRAITFKPIHRVVFNINVENFIHEMLIYFRKRKNFTVHHRTFETETSMNNEFETLSRKKGIHAFPYIAANTFGIIAVEQPDFNLEIATLQSFLDDFLRKNPDSKIDYIHGKDSVMQLCSKQGNIGFLLPAMDKNDLFKTIILDGVLPRKAFSMGEADEKRFYLECRKIKQA